MSNKPILQQLLDELPISAELYWQLRRQLIPPRAEPYWQEFQSLLPEWVSEARQLRQANAQHPLVPSKRLLIFGSQRYWIKYATLLALAMAGLGHQVSLAYAPYIKWQERINRFERYRQAERVREVLEPATDLLNVVPFTQSEAKSRKPLPALLSRAIEEVALRDVQYTLQVEEVDLKSDLYRLRMERNTQAARAALAWMQAHRPQAVITPNGSILEMGAVYEAARFLELPVVTYEFGEQRGRIWMALNDEVMRQETGALWAARRDQLLDETHWQEIRALFDSRQRASLWENFARLWQGQPARGGEHVRRELGLDERPVFLLPANVIGDSLTLGRQVFSQSMTEWLERTIQYFAGRPEVQLVVRIHPGERYLKGPSVGDLALRQLPNLGKDPALSHIHLVAADDPINTYDLVEIADLGMVYTTTVGLEMAMSGVPVLVAGVTHYRSKGFTLDPDSWDSYFALLDRAILGFRGDHPPDAHPPAFRLEREQVEQAWNYAYRFFFEFPLPFPWHLLDYKEKLEEWPLERTLSAEGWAEFGGTFRCLAGEPRDWPVPPSGRHLETAQDADYR
jgi:hypothetical protein